MGMGCLATLQIGVATVLGPADAILDIERFGASTHVESPTTADCAFGHGHGFCQLVRSLYKAGISSGIPFLRDATPPLLLPEPGPDAHRVAPAPVLLGSGTPRAPPIA